MTKTFRASPASEQSFTLGEGPVWDSRRQRALWVDIAEGQIWDGMLVEDEIVARTTHHFGQMIGAAVPTNDGGILAAGQKTLEAIDRDGNRYSSKPIIGAGLNSRFNDGSCDPQGRFFVGSMSLDDSRNTDSLYVVDPRARASVVEGGLSLSNGIGWSPAGTEMYHIDSVEKTLWRMPYDPQTGNPGERVVVLTGGDRPESPDGLAVDNDGNLWVAYWGAGQVRCHDPRTGEVLATVEVAAPHTTSVAFIGPGQDRLLITTARENLTPEQLEEFPDSGKLFIADVGVRGFLRSPWMGEAASVGGA